MNLSCRPIDASLVEVMRPWYEDAETQRFLHGPEDLDTVLDLIEKMPGSELRGSIVTFRQEWVFFDGDEPVGACGVETYDHTRTSVSILVAPEHRGKGVGMEMLQQASSLPGLESTTVLEGGVEPDNKASIRALEKAGFNIAEEVDHEGFLMVTKRVRRG